MSIDLTKYDEVDPKALLIGVAHLHEELDARDAEISRLRAERDALLLELTKVKQRYEWLKGLFSPMSLNIDGNHSWVCRGTISRLKGPNMDEAIDNASGNFSAVGLSKHVSRGRGIDGGPRS